MEWYKDGYDVPDNDEQETYCEICEYYDKSEKWCTLWDVEVTDSENSHCESYKYVGNRIENTKM